ncbi:MAG: dihydroorotate dehydrogenase electron transfer subunit [Candidatus Accumulibacter sp.]|jgi:dihydroorotate dehydrogenase electron transfer subunit|nr:dihydroorotate dehydrogenase electron transfer subunit [Accumulibacter sp.]
MSFAARILSNAGVGRDYWRIRLSAPGEFAGVRAGQFVMARVGGGADPLLRRPLAVFDAGARPAEDGGAWFEMLYKVVGKGTALLSARREGEEIDILGPLGRGFDLGDENEEKLLVGGGVGLAPLHLLASRFIARGAKPRLFAGGRSAGDLPCLADFERLGVEIHAATEDGSLGARGLVTAPLLEYLDGIAGRAALFACGPEGMLRAVAGIAAGRGLACQVSLESRMACGVGACLGCVTPGRGHSPGAPNYRCVCSEGPVFAAGELAWGG